MKIIRVRGVGRLGNQMFQYLLAHILQDLVPDAAIVGPGLPEFNLPASDVVATEPGAHVIVIKGHVFPFRETVLELKRRPKIEVDIRRPIMRMEYLSGRLPFARNLFPIDPRLKTGFDERYLVIHIRAEDVLDRQHPNYTVLPIAWYRHLIELSGLEPVFIGQIGDDPYSQALRDAFPRSQFIRNENPLEDFNQLRTSVNVVLSMSTFCWLAAWMSETMRRAYLPIIGMYHPLERPDVDMLPVGDRRYRFYLFEPRTAPAPVQDAISVERQARFDEVRWPRIYRTRVAWSLKDRRQEPTVWRDLRSIWSRN